MITTDVLLNNYGCGGVGASVMAAVGRQRNRLWHKMVAVDQVCKIRYRGRKLLSSRQLKWIALLERFKCQEGACGSALRRLKR